MPGHPVGSPRRSQLDLLRRSSTRAHVYGLLRSAIVSADLLPGQALSENELAARHSVSRTPVREALIRLADEGLVEVVPQLGTFVSRISVRDVIEAQFIRETLERAALPQTIRNISAEHGEELHQILREQDAAGRKGDVPGWFATDEDLHRRLVEIGGHPKVWPIVSTAKAHLDRVRMLALTEPGILSGAYEDHRVLVSRVLGKERRKADETMARHLRIAPDLLELVERHHPDYFLHDDTPADRPAISRRSRAAR